MNNRLHIFALVILATMSCAKKQSGAWDDIDYSKVHDREARENDTAYVMPSIANCVDDDLYNCR